MQNKVITLMRELWENTEQMEIMVKDANDNQLYSIYCYLKNKHDAKKRKYNIENEIRKMKNEAAELIKQPEFMRWQENKELVEFIREK